MTSTIGIPIKLLNEAQGHIITLELDSGTTYRGKLIEGRQTGSHSLPYPHHNPHPRPSHHCAAMLTYNPREPTAEDNMNIQLKDITVTARDGRVSHLEQVYIRGSHVRFFIVPDMLRYAQTLNPTPPTNNSPSGAKGDSSDNNRKKKGTSVTNVSARVSRNAPMFKSRNARGRGVGLARGRATVSRARASGRGGR